MKATVRDFIRHPSELPIHCTRADKSKSDGPRLRDIAVGGICFECSAPIEPGDALEVSIPLLDQTHKLHGRVVWCHRAGDGYHTGVEFDNEDDAFRARMVEQVCHIEAYRSRMEAEEGRRLSSQEAAKEWIKKYAKDFPRR